MKAFELPAGTRLKLTKATPRKEHHGNELVQAISLRLRWETTNDSLAKLHPNLKAMLFYRSAPVEAQVEIDGVPEITPNLRCPVVGLPLKVDASFSGYQFTIEHGIDDSTALQFYECELDKFAVDAKEGGTAIIDWSLSSNKEVTPELVGAICALEGEEITSELVAPEVQPDPKPVIDGTGEDFRKDHPEAGELFAAAHGGSGTGDEDDGDPSIPTGDGGAADDDDLGGGGDVEHDGPRTSDDPPASSTSGDDDDPGGFERGLKQAIDSRPASPGVEASRRRMRRNMPVGSPS